MVAALAGCGGSAKESQGPSPTEGKAACTGTPLTAPLKLPQGFPQVIEDKLLFTRQHTAGPTAVVEGYFRGSLPEAHDDFEEEIEDAGFEILSDEREEDDSEVSWSGRGRSGQVALRRACPTPDKIYVRITNRPA